MFQAPTLGSMYGQKQAAPAAPAGLAFSAPDLGAIMAGLAGPGPGPNIPPRPTPPPAPTQPGQPGQPAPRPAGDFARYLELAHPGFNSANMRYPGYMERFFQAYGR